MKIKIVFIHMVLLLQSSWATPFLWDEKAQENSLAIKELKTRSSGSLRVFWWNVEKGLTNMTLGNHSLEQNLKALANGALSPDVIILGEMTSKAISSDTMDELMSVYPYSSFEGYNSESKDLGILSLSKFPFKAFAAIPLDWTPEGLSSVEIKNYRQHWKELSPKGYRLFTRPYLRLRIDLGENEVDVIAFHGVMPWEAMMKDWGRFSSSIGKIEVGLTLMDLKLTQRDPLNSQLRNLKKQMQHDFGENLDAGNLVLIGDFNTPMTVYGVSTLAKILFKDLNNVTSEEEVVSFPSRSSEIHSKYTGLRIDHAFISKHTELIKSSVLEFQGSDHYPLLLEIRPR